MELQYLPQVAYCHESIDPTHYIQSVISTPCIRMLMLLFTTGNVDEFVRKMTISRRF